MSSQILASFQTDDSDTGPAPTEEPVKHRSRWLRPALFAVVSLVIIQVCVGILLKVVQEHNT
jgi:type II secretory pathway component PulF